MDFLNVIDTRKTIRKYSDYIPTTDEIKRIIESARLAPSAMNTQNWEFIAIYNQEIKDALAGEVLKVYDEILDKLDEETKAGIERYKGHSTFFAKAPVIIVCVEKNAASFMGGILEKAGYSKEEISNMRPDSYLLSMGGAIENMLLTACVQGLGSCWMVAPVLAYKGMKEVLGLDEADKIVSILTFGRPNEENDRRSNKKSLDEIMRIIK